MTILQGTLKLHVHSVKFLADNLPPNLLPEDTVAVVAIVVKSANAKKQEILRTSPKIFVDASKIETMSPTQLDTTWNAKHEILVCQDIASVVVELRGTYFYRWDKGLAVYLQPMPGKFCVV